MDDMIELEDYCVFCSKYLAGMHDFNKKMHFNTCKLRKLFDSVYTDSDTSDVDQFYIDDNCGFCLKPLKDFKSEYNKRIHIKCCKIKKETFERRDSILQLQQSEEQSAATSTQSNDLSPAASLLQSLTEACIFCSKPLGNLNSFNRKMHIEHCKIRKSLEGNIRSSSKNKDENKVKSADTVDQCVYCNKSFARLSEFNRRLHSEHCKSKKRKLKTLNNVINSSINLSALNSPESNYGANLDQVQNSLILLTNNSCPNTPIKGTSSLNISSSLDQSTSQNNSVPQLNVHSCEYCEFCSRSLANLSNFNKNIHIEQCKLKQAKKNGQVKQSSRPRKRTKTNDKDKSQQNEL